MAPSTENDAPKPGQLEDVSGQQRGAEWELLLRCTLVGFGTKRHFTAPQQMVAIGGKADITRMGGKIKEAILQRAAGLRGGEV